MPERVVFLDETSVKTNLTRLRGRFLRGTRLTASAPFGSWGTQTLIAGLGPSDLIVPWVIKGAMEGSAFVAYIRDARIPEIEPGTAVILPSHRIASQYDCRAVDNLATHRKKEAEALLQEHGCWFLFLPPYSPDLNPIEMAFSKFKANLRRIGARSLEAPQQQAVAPQALQPLLAGSMERETLRSPATTDPSSSAHAATCKSAAVSPRGVAPPEALSPRQSQPTGQSRACPHQTKVAAAPPQEFPHASQTQHKICR